MKIYKKEDETKYITISAKRNKILTNKHGFIMITKGNHKRANIISKEELEKEFIIPENIIIKD